MSLEGSHYYDSTGRAVFEVPKKRGPGMRPTTIKDARELGSFSAANPWSIFHSNIYTDFREQ